MWPHPIVVVELVNRSASGLRLNGAVVSVLDADGNVLHTFPAISGADNGEIFSLDLPTAMPAHSIYIDGPAGQYIHLAEINVFGHQVPSVNLTDLHASEMTITQSSTYGGYGTSNLLDNNTSTFNHTGAGANEWINLEFNDEYWVTSVQITNRSVSGVRLNGAVVELRDANDHVVHAFAPITGADNGEVFDLVLDHAVVASSVYINGVAAQYLHIAELNVFGSEFIA